MALIVHIETATKKCSVALAQNGQLLAQKQIAEEQFNHAEKLHQFITEVLQTQQKTFTDLQAVSVSMGPGSYTGLRIGVSAAKGLCYALEIPLIAVNTLEILARSISISDGLIIPMIDARRMEVYTAVYSSEYKELSPTHALVVEADSLDELSTKQTIHLLGDGAQKTKNILNPHNVIYHDEKIYPSAEDMITLSYEKYLQQAFEDVAYFEPYYLKDFLVK